jgi:uncharacterized NAD-dependent epimerase/dehydratase family protein
VTEISGVHSSARAQATASARALKLSRVREDLHRLRRGPRSRHYPTAEKVGAKIAVVSTQRRAGAYLITEVGTDPDTGKPTLTWELSQEAIEAEVAADGWYALLSNLDAGQADAAQVLLLVHRMARVGPHQRSDRSLAGQRRHGARTEDHE